MSFFRIPIRIHWSWFIFAALFLGREVALLNFVGVQVGLALLFSAFIAVLFHELAHALVARHLGYETEKITMHLFGGLAEIRTQNIKNYEMIIIALSGPMSNLLLATLCLISLLIPFSTIFPRLYNYMIFFGLLNLMVGVFNLTPAWPMDGGRVVRAGLFHLGLRESIVMNISHFLTIICSIALFSLGVSISAPSISAASLLLLGVIYAERRRGMTF